MTRKLVQTAGMALAAVIGMTAVAGAQDDGFSVEKADKAFNIEVDHAVILNVDNAFNEVSVAQPEIADISSLSGKSLYVLGKTPGSTTVTLLNADGTQNAYTVFVSSDIGAILDFARGALGNVEMAVDGLVVSATGCVADAQGTAALEQATKAIMTRGYTVLQNIGDC